MTKVLITGGGIGGISAALSLIKHGFEVEVYEQVSALRQAYLQSGCTFRLFKGYERHKVREFFTTLRTLESRLREMQEPQRRQLKSRKTADATDGAVYARPGRRLS
jgi:2-polyprenyl-6-methoxyphenol hydroxylase-like FAD-dependent oxidoreductase